MKSMVKNSLIIGFALFASFFGAGNLIFPPHIGITSGSEWFTALCAFFISGIVFPMCGFIAVALGNDTEEGIAEELGLIPAKILVGTIMICACVLIIIPRTAAVTYEMSIEPFFPQLPAWIFSLFYFGAAVFFSINPSTVMNKVGTYLTPFLLVMMAIIIVKGVFFPLGTPQDLEVTGTFTSSFISGYQTLDAIGGMVFSGAILAAILSKGYTDKRSTKQMALCCALVGGAGMLLIYGGLIYLGATCTSVFSADMEKTALLKAIVTALLGNFGGAILGAAVFLACLTSAIAGLAGISYFFQRLSPVFFPYKRTVSIVAILGFTLSTFRVEQIVSFAIPILLTVYPVVIVLIILGLCRGVLPKKREGLYRGAVCATLCISFLSILPSLGVTVAEPIMSKLPLAQDDFAWILPAVIGGMVGHMLQKSNMIRT